MDTLINKFKKLFKEAHEKINKIEEDKEAAKWGTFRVGSSGALRDGDVYSTQCGRLGQARLLGYQSPPTQEMRVMFNGGITLEDYVQQRLEANNLPFIKEHSHAVELLPGITVSGRPDFEVEIDGEIIGIEVKSLASPTSVIKHEKNRFPYMKHLIQAATYMTLLDRKRWLIAVGHTFYVNERGHKIPPKVTFYELHLLDGSFVVTNAKNENALLPFTKEHIYLYYKEMDAAVKEKRLMSRPKEEEINVDTYSRCNYCPMKSACNEYDNKQIDFQSWLQRIKVNKEKDQSE